MQYNALSTDGKKKVASEVCGRFKEQLEKVLTDPEAANLCGSSVRTIQNWKTKVPIPSDKLALFNGTGVDVNYVLTGRAGYLKNVVNESGGLNKAYDVEGLVGEFVKALAACREYGIPANEKNLVAVTKSILKNADKDEGTMKAVLDALASVLVD